MTADAKRLTRGEQAPHTDTLDFTDRTLSAEKVLQRLTHECEDDYNRLLITHWSLLDIGARTARDGYLFAVRHPNGGGLVAGPHDHPKLQETSVHYLQYHLLNGVLRATEEMVSGGDATEKQFAAVCSKIYPIYRKSFRKRQSVSLDKFLEDFQKYEDIHERFFIQNKPISADERASAMSFDLVMRLAAEKEILHYAQPFIESQVHFPHKWIPADILFELTDCAYWEGGGTLLSGTERRARIGNQAVAAFMVDENRYWRGVLDPDYEAYMQEEVVRTEAT